MSSILGLIPARAGSRGVPGKNHKLLAGQPLVTYTIQSALASRLLQKVALSSDCPETIRITSTFPDVEIPFIRPGHLAQDETPSTAVIRHAVEFYTRRGTHFNYVCLLQPTTPFRARHLIDNSINHMLSAGAESLVTIRPIPHAHSPYWSIKMNEQQRIQPVMSHRPLIARRQGLPVTYHRDGQIYILTASMAMREELMNENTIGYINDESPDINIDMLSDWQKAENWIAYERQRF